jgi:hypothetical protein
LVLKVHDLEASQYLQNLLIHILDNSRKQQDSSSVGIRIGLLTKLSELSKNCFHGTFDLVEICSGQEGLDGEVSQQSVVVLRCL